MCMICCRYRKGPITALDIIKKKYKYEANVTCQAGPRAGDDGNRYGGIHKP